MMIKELTEAAGKYDGKSRVFVALYSHTEKGAVIVEKARVFGVYKNGGVVYIRANRNKRPKKTYDKTRSPKSV